MWITGIVLDVMDQHGLSRGIVRSYTWGGTQLLLFLPVHYSPLLRRRPAIGPEKNVKLLFSPCSRQHFFCGLELFAEGSVRPGDVR